MYALGKDDVSVQRAKLEVDYKHHGKGYVFGAFRPETGEAVTKSYTRRTLENWIDFLGLVEEWVSPEVKRIYAIMDNLNLHKGTDTILFSLAHERWEFVYQPIRAAYLNLIEPWWKNLRSLAFSGHCFEAWEELCEAVKKATEYWNGHRHPFVWGRRKRHQRRRSPGVALVTAHP